MVQQSNRSRIVLKKLEIITDYLLFGMLLCSRGGIILLYSDWSILG